MTAQIADHGDAPTVTVNGATTLGAGTANHGASLTARDMRAWRPVRGSPDADLLPELDQLVARARDLDRNNGIAKSGIQAVLDNVVGSGLRLSCRPNYIAMGKTKDWAQTFAKQVEAQWVGYAETTACDAADSLIFDHMTALQLRSQLMNGEHLALPLWVPNRGDGWSTKIQTVECDRLSNPQDKFDTTTLRGGVELDQYGGPVAYNIKTVHPGDLWYSGLALGPAKWERIPKRTNDKFRRLRVIHGFDKERSGQTRGKPILSSVLSEFKNIDRYKHAEIQAAVANAMVAGTIETPMDQDSILQLFNSDGDKYMAERKEYAVDLEPGTLLPLFPGDKVQPFLPARPATSFGPFMENVLRMIAASMDLPYEMLLKDFTKTTYSSARAAMLEAWRAFYRRRDMLSTAWCDPVYALWFEEAVHAGKIDVTPADFYANKQAYLRCRWIGPGRGYVDPTKEAQAAVYRVQNNLSTLEDECAEQGKDYREVLEQRRVEQDLIKELMPEQAALAANPASAQSKPAAAGQPAPPVPKKPAAAKSAAAEVGGVEAAV